MNIIGVVIDDYKLDTFKEVFAAHKVKYELGAGPTSESLTLRVETEDPYALQVIVQEANEKARIADNKRVPVDEPTSTSYELWSTETNRLLGTIELGAHPSLEHKARVTVKLKKGYVTDASGKAFNAFELLVCQMDNRDPKTKRITRRYWALETNLPLHIAKHLEGFTPRIERPSLAQMFFLERHKNPIVVKK